MAPQLLLCVVNEPSKVEEILEAFIDIGVTGATVVDTYGMGGLLAREVPIFAGFRQLLSGSGSSNRTIFSVISDEEMLEAAVQAIEAICGNLENPSTGILVTVPVSRVVGLSPGIE